MSSVAQIAWRFRFLQELKQARLFATTTAAELTAISLNSDGGEINSTLSLDFNRLKTTDSHS